MALPCSCKKPKPIDNSDIPFCECGRVICGVKPKTEMNEIYARIAECEEAISELDPMYSNDYDQKVGTYHAIINGYRNLPIDIFGFKEIK